MLNLNKIFLLLSILLIGFVVYKKYKKSGFSGYADKDDPYIEPQIYNDVITPGEATYILHKAKNIFEASIILSGNDTSVRKSKTAWLYKDDPIVYQLYQRLSKQFNFEISNAEPLQIVKYEPGGFYNEHHDSCCDANETCVEFSKDHGQRKLTILIYLNDDFQGGSTYFPELNLNIKAPKYGAVVFYPLDTSNEKCHPLAIHKGTEVTSGVKYVCNVWVRQKNYS
jgi:prolyl 4-hydroxylase